MKFNFSIIQNRIDSINFNNNKIDNDHILNIVFNQISKIEETNIDIDKSKFISKEKNSYELILISKSGKNCPFYINIFDNKIDFQLNEGGEYLYIQTINSKSDVNKLRQAISDVMLSSIIEKLKFCNGKIIFAQYCVNHVIDNEINPFHYTISLGICFPWRKKEIRETFYEPWIN